MNVPFVIGRLYDGAGQHDLANAVHLVGAETSPMRPMAVVRLASNLDAMGESRGRRSGGSATSSSPTRRTSTPCRRWPTCSAPTNNMPPRSRTTRAFSPSPAARPRPTGDTTTCAASLCERSNQLPLAETDFKRALVLNPDQPSVLNYLGYTWVDKGMHLTEALAMIPKAVAGSPNDGYIIDPARGWAYFRLGRFDDAVTELERAVKLKPNDPEINDHLGDACWRVGRKRATFQWNIATSVDTEGNVKARVAPSSRTASTMRPPPSDSAPVDASSSSAPASN